MLPDLTPNIAEIQEDHALQSNIKFVCVFQSHIHYYMTKIGKKHIAYIYAST